MQSIVSVSSPYVGTSLLETHSPKTKQEAVQSGSKVFFTGVPCKNGHIAPRFVSDGRCETCRKENGKKYYGRYKSDVLSKRKKRYLKNKDHEKQYMSQWRKNNREKCRKYGRSFIQRNPGYSTPYMANYRYKCAQATPHWVDEDALKQMYRNCPKGMHVDHIIPINGEYVCGLHVPWNLQYLTPEENISKSNKVIENGA